MIGDDGNQALEAALRSLATAARSLRLYPASSSIPRQSVDAAVSGLEALFNDGEPFVALAVTRDGFAWRGEPVGASSNTQELAEALREHGVAEMTLTPGCNPDRLLAFLQLIERDPASVRDEGGLANLACTAGVQSIRLTEVQLNVVEQIGPAEDEDIHEFLRQLIRDPQKLAAWFAAAAAGDPRTFEEGLMELVLVSGPSGFPELLDSLSFAFLQQDYDARDVLMGLSMDRGPTRDLSAGMFGLLGAGEIAGSVLGGKYGRNMLSLSSALTRLPLEQVTAQVRAEVQAMLPGAGHTPKEAGFLDHMLEVRAGGEPEAPLVDADRTYRAVVEAATLSDEMIERARSAVAGSGGELTAASVRTMLTLLDQQRDLELYSDSLTAIAGIVPRLVEQKNLKLASTVLAELADREAAESIPWPELSGRLREALESAAGPRTMAALVRVLTEDGGLIEQARAITLYAGDSGAPALVAEAIAHKAEGLEIAEQLLGRRIVDLLAQLATSAQWYQLGPIAARLARENDPRSRQVVEGLLRHPDPSARREVLAGLASAAAPLSLELLGLGVRDENPEVAAVAARGIARLGGVGSASLLGARIAEIDLDNTDYSLGRELIAALARVSDPAADEQLEKLANRKALIKRGHFAEVQDLVRQAIGYRHGGGGSK